MSGSRYASFIEGKTRRHGASGIEVPESDIHQSLFRFQNAVARWGLSKGKACIFAGTGLGKTRMQCEIMRHIPGKRLLVSPLAVAEQTITEARLLNGMRIKRIHSQDDVSGDGTYIINYDRLRTVEGINWDAVGLDESSIIKSHDGSTREYIQDRFSATPYRYAFTATPSPNDYMELGTHAEFMGAMTRQEMFATFFVHDGGDTSKWRLKGHAVEDFWKWVSSWAVVFSHPRDIGYDQQGYDLPPLHIHDHIVQVESTIADGLFGDGAISATQLYPAMRESAESRALMVKQIVDADPGNWLIWVYTDEDQRWVEKMVPGIATVKGPDSNEQKVDRLLGFATGVYDSLVTKPKIAGFGMNWQRTNKMIFNGITHSFEQVYQCIRRQWRFGQQHPVNVHMVTCNAMETVRAAQSAKQEAFLHMGTEMAKYCVQEVSR